MTPDPLSATPIEAARQLDPHTTLVDRRGFLTTAGAASLAALLTTACGSGDGGGAGPGGPTAPGGPLPGGIVRDGNQLRIEIAAVPSLQGTNGFVVVPEPATIVVYLGADGFRAFTAVCTHAGCRVSGVSNRRIVCPCHGSAFDVQGGQVLAGPATRSLRSFPVTLANGILIVTAA
jgi:nitrite reductase/ring-hydroxylating ferredoxin subunit